MIKLGKLTDYAVVVMAQLCREGTDVSISAHQISSKTGLPEPTVAKVLKKLAREKLVCSARGVSGGYKLSCDPTVLSVCDIIEAMEGPISIASCVDNAEEHCIAEKACPVRGKWNPVNDAIRDALRSVRLADISVSCGGGKTVGGRTFIPLEAVGRQ